jgi:hypothetical protein
MIPIRPEIPPAAPNFRPPRRESRPRTLAWPDLRPPPTQTRPKANDPHNAHPSATPRDFRPVPPFPRFRPVSPARARSA